MCQRRTPTFAEQRTALQEALVNVAQESFFAFAEACETDRFSEALVAVGAQSAGSANDWLRSRVEFEGAFAGVIELTLPYALAADLLMSFTGLMPDEVVPESHVFDSTGEFANMVCGTWLTHACARRRFDLRSPVVTPAGPPVERVTDGQEALMLVNDQPVSMRLEFRPS
ncbi:MAG: hypothetical protein NT151_01995 [Acidobacteria bacterium]|nr:hypothetical protein [Acidobacteriota bacterium]